MVNKTQSSQKKDVFKDVSNISLLSEWVLPYTDLIMQQAGLTHLDPAFRLDYMEQLSQRVQQKVGLIILESLDDNGLESLASHMESHALDDTDAWKSWFNEYMPDIKERIEKGLTDFGTNFIKTVQEERERYRQKAHADLQK